MKKEKFSEKRVAYFSNFFIEVTCVEAAECSRQQRLTVYGTKTSTGPRSNRPYLLALPQPLAHLWWKLVDTELQKTTLVVEDEKILAFLKNSANAW